MAKRLIEFELVHSVVEAVLGAMWGNAAYHRDRFASANGY